MRVGTETVVLLVHALLRVRVVLLRKAVTLGARIDAPPLRVIVRALVLRRVAGLVARSRRPDRREAEGAGAGWGFLRGASSSEGVASRRLVGARRDLRSGGESSSSVTRRFCERVTRSDDGL